ncbi:hypothetical protein DFQ30_009857 [Apophysomyces sp. BC1015]|nr:hypothetical protein DFQ30_009857 [Apophysomyces sp. BC1015]
MALAPAIRSCRHSGTRAGWIISTARPSRSFEHADAGRVADRRSGRRAQQQQRARNVCIDVAQAGGIVPDKPDVAQHGGSECAAPFGGAEMAQRVDHRMVVDRVRQVLEEDEEQPAAADCGCWADETSYVAEQQVNRRQQNVYIGTCVDRIIEGALEGA